MTAITTRFAAVACTIVLSATVLLGAIGPAAALDTRPAAARVA